jgi:polysaccharide biosynthesis protein PslH
LKKKLLIISPYLPTLDEGGRIRVFNAIKNISKYLDVYLICFIYSEEEKKTSELIKPFCKEVSLVFREHKERKKNIIAKILRILFSPPDLITKRSSNIMHSKINDLITRIDFDLIQCLHQYTVQYLPKIKNIPFVLVEHNIESEILNRAFNYSDVYNIINISKSNLRNKIELFKLRRYEQKSWKKFVSIITVSEIDKQMLLNRLHNANVTIIPNGVDTTFYYPYDNIEEDGLVCSGTYSHQPNLDAVLYFYKYIFTLIKENIPDIKFTIAGKNMPADVQTDLSKDKNVLVTGYVEDIRPYIAAAKLFIVPIRIGSGTRLKILQAMAMKKCIISTSIGCEGIDVKDNYNIIIADDEKTFADKVIDVYNNFEKRKFISENAYKTAIQKYDWKEIFQEQINLYKNILN